MSPRGRRRRALVAAAAALVLLVACGGGDDDDTGPARNGTTATTAGERGGASEADEAEAARIGFHFYDFPAGWREDPQDSPDKAEEDPLERKLETCAGGADPAEDKETAKVTADFSIGRTVRADSEVIVLPSGKLATASVEYFTAGNFAECFKTLLLDNLKEAFPAGASVTDAAVTRDDPDLPGVRAFRYVMRFTIEGPRALTLHVDFVGLQKGRAIAGLNFTSAPAAFDRQVEDRLVGKVAERLRTTR